MTSIYANSLDIYRQDNFCQKEIDDVTHNVVLPNNANLPDASMQEFHVRDGQNVVPGSVKLLYRGKFTTAAGADLVAGRYSLMHGAGVMGRIAANVGSHHVEEQQAPGRVAAMNSLIKMSAATLREDGPRHMFVPAGSAITGAHVRPGTTTPSIGYEPVDDRDYVDRPARVHHNVVGSTMALTAAGGVCTGAAGFVFNDEMLGATLTVAGINYTIVSIVSAVAGVVYPAAAANVVAGAYTITYPATSGRFLKASAPCVAGPASASAEFGFEVPLSLVLGFFATDKIIPLADWRITVEKETNWARAITKRGLLANGTALPDAIFKVTSIKLAYTTVNPRDRANLETLTSMAEGTPMTYRYLEYHYQNFEAANSTQAIVDSKISGYRVKDLFVAPQLTLSNGSQEYDHLASNLTAAQSAYTSAYVNVAGRMHPRVQFRGSDDDYLPEYAAWRRACDYDESEGSSFVNYKLWKDAFPIFYVDLSERSEKELLSTDQNVIFHGTFNTAVARTFHFLSTSERELEMEVSGGYSKVKNQLVL